jgi:hypothetical protein
LGLIAAAAAIPLACDDGGPVQRGYGSQQLLQLRDPTFRFDGSLGDLVYYQTDADASAGGTRTYWSLDIGTGELENLGISDPTRDQPSTNRYVCVYHANAEGLYDVYEIQDTQTAQFTLIENVVMTSPYCPTDADTTMIVWRRETDSTRTLWIGPFANLQQVALPIVVHQALWHENAASLVSAPSPTTPAGLGIYSVPDQDPTAATEIVPAALAELVWAPGATPSAALASAGLPESRIPFWSAGSGHYTYTRAMDDYSRVMFAGPYDAGGPTELALFPVATDDGLTMLRLEPYHYRYDGDWQLTTAWASIADATHSRLRIWRDALGRLTTCTWPGDQNPVAIGDPENENALIFMSPNSTTPPETFPLLLMMPAFDGDSACKVLATAGVDWADFSPDGSAAAWTVQSFGDTTLWRSGRDGSGPRAIGTGMIANPRFVGDSQLEFTNDGDLVWVDVNDDSGLTHFVTEQVFGTAIDLGRWAVTGHDYSVQDGNGQLALVNRDTGETRPISPAVVQYMSPDVVQRGTTIGVFMENGTPVRIVYLVRGRNPSSQDGIWVATITQQDRE